MELQAFKLERWFAEHEFKVEYNLCASCAGVTTTRELLELAGGEVTADYHALGLDYIPSEGTPGLRKTIAGTYNGLGTEEVRVTTGASEAIFILMNVLLRPGDEIIVQTPVYQSLFSVAQGIGCRVRFWPAPMENGFLPSPDMLKALITENTKALVINNPNSPTGAVFPEDYLTRLAEIAEDHDLLLVADEVYRGLVLGTGMSNVSPVELSEKAVSIGDLTKPFGLGGLRVGWLASRNRGLLSKCGEFRDYTTMCCAAPSEFLATVVLENREALLREKIKTAKNNLKVFSQFVSRHQNILEWVPPMGGVSAFPRFKPGLPARDFCTRLVKEKSVLLLPGDVFDMPDHFRVGFGMKPEAFLEGLGRVEEFISTFG